MENSKFMCILIKSFNPFMSESIIRDVKFIKIEITTIEHLL